MKNMTFKRSKLGFTLTELLLVIAILVILVGLGVTGFVALRRNIVIAKYDDLAREIYVSTQNQLTRLEANGMDQNTVQTLNGGDSLTAMPSDYTGDWTDELQDAYRYADKSNEAMAVLLPLGAVADDVRSNGFYVIEYNVQTRTVYGVFYSESSFQYSDVSGIPDFRTSRNVRKGPMVGYYGGSAVARDPLTHCEAPRLEIINNNELRLNILNVPTDVTASVRISDGTHTVDVPASQIGYQGSDNRTVLLDSMEPDGHFYQLFSELTPGKDLTITVTYAKPGAISASASVKTNSLFATREGESGEIVTLAWARHLQNLENSVSNLNDPDIATARQIEHIQWEDEFDPFVSIRNNGTNIGLKRFEGNGLEIRDLKGANGLFAQTKEGMQLSGIRIVNPVITAADTAPVGALAGTAAPGTAIHMCGVYSSKLKNDQTVDYDAYQKCYVDGKNAVTGGLVGQATNTEVTYSFAALPSIKGQNGGASLIGDADRCTISNSYANCDDLQPGFRYFLSGGSNTVTHCYAVGNVADSNFYDFAAGQGNITDCYYAVSHRRFAENWSDNEDLALTQFCYIGEDGNWITVDQEQMQEATNPNGWAEGKNWTNTIAPLSHPYREYLDGRAFPYPAIGELDHYGSWPDGDGKLDLKITMDLLNSQDGAYAIFAGQVIVRDPSGSVLFNSKDHKKPDGSFDGLDTVQVAPGDKVRIEVTPESGYEYLYTAIEGARYNPAAGATAPFVVNYTVRKNTEAVITFRQLAFSLTGMPAEDGDGNKISGAQYGMDLTSPVMTLNISNSAQTKRVETGSTVTVRPKVPAGYSASVVWYAPKDGNTLENRTYLTEGTDGNYSFTMPAQDTEVHVMYTVEEAYFNIQYYLMDTEGNYPDSPTQTAAYKCGLGSQINQSMINSMANSSGLPLTIEKERVRYLAHGVVTAQMDGSQNVVFESRLDESGKVTKTTPPHLTAEGETSQEQPYTVKIYIERKLYNVTLTADAHVSGVRFGNTGDFRSSVTGQFRYGATVTAQANVEPGYRFTYWDPQDSRFMMSADTQYSFQVPQFNLNLKATAASDRYLVTVNLLENNESWLYSMASRQADPITLTLVNSADPTKTYPMQVLTEDSVSYAMQAVVPAVVPEEEGYEEGYYVRVNYKSGLETWIYTNGTRGGTDAENEKLLLYVRDKAVEATAPFFSVTYHAAKKDYNGSVPKSGTYPMYYHLTVEGNSGLLQNLTDQDTIFAGWKDYYAEGTGSSTIYTGKEILMVTRRTDMFAQWVQSLSVTYHPGEADGGTLPVDRNNYQLNEKVSIQWGGLTRKGYQFIGWSKTEHAETPDFEEGKLEYLWINTPLHLYPVWRLEEYSVQCYDINGTRLTGDGYQITGKHYNDLVTVPAIPSDAEGVIGWSVTKGGPLAYRPGETFKITGNTELYACLAADQVQITFQNSTGDVTYRTDVFGKGIPGFLNCVPTIDEVPAPVTAWSTLPNGKGTLYFCDESGRSERDYAFTEDTDLYAVTGKVYNYNRQLWYDTLYAAVRAGETGDGHTLIVYRDTVEPHNVWINKSLYIIASGSRTVKWMDGATVDSGDKHRLDDTAKETGELVGCMSVSKSGNGLVTLTFGRSDVSGLVPAGSTLTFDANGQSRVISLGNGATFHMYDGVTLTNGKRVRSGNPDENSETAISNSTCRSFYGGGVYAGLNSVFYMHGGTISHCSAYKGGGVYLFANKYESTPGSKMYMGDMVTPTAYSATAIYYTKGDDGFYINAQENVTAENYKKYYITVGNPQICYNTSTRNFENEWSNDDGGGGLLMLDLKDGDLVLFKGNIHNNTAFANGGGIVTDGGDTVGGVPGDDAKLRIYEVDISHNTAYGFGGGIYQWQGVVYVYNSLLRQNYALKSGGGIYLHHYGTEKSTIEFHYGDIADNKALENGGGIYVEDRQVMTITNGNLARNIAGWDGGGVYVAKAGEINGTLQLQGGTIVDNTAGNNGGGVCSSGIINMTGGTLSGNDAGNWGGGIYTNGTMSMSGGTICDNNGRYLGGGIFMGGTLNLSGGSLYGNTDTDYPPNNHREDEDNANPGPNDIYLLGDQKITIPAGGIALSGEERVAVDCERDGSLRFPNTTLPYRFAVYTNPADFEAWDALYFTYFGTRSTQHSVETLKKADLTVKTHEDLTGEAVGLYFAEQENDDNSSYLIYNLNYPEAPAVAPVEKEVGTELNLYDEVPTAAREGYYLVGWARTPNAREEQYELLYDVVENVWRSGYVSGTGWTKTDTEPKYTVQNLFSQTLYAMWRPCVAVYNLGEEAQANGVSIQPTSIGPSVVLLNPEPAEYHTGDKTYRFQYWVNEDTTDTRHYMPMEQLDLKENIRLRAVWEERVANSVIITFYFNSGTSDQTGEMRREVAVEIGGSYKIDVDIRQANKFLAGWNTSPDGTGDSYAVDAQLSNLEADMDLYAMWEDAVSLTYDINGGEGTGHVFSYRKGETVAVGDFTPVRADYDFLGWADTPNATQAKYKIGDTLDMNQNTTLFAVWKPVKYWTVSFDLGGGTGVGFAPAKVRDGASFVLPQETPERTGCAFAHWSYGTTGSAEPGGSVAVTSDMTFTARWQCTVSFDLMGGQRNGSPTIKDEVVFIGKQLPLEHYTPTKNGFVFLGWAKSEAATAPEFGPTDAATVEENMKLYALWAEAVTLSYDMNGGTGSAAPVTVAKGSKVTITDSEPAREGYFFKGWTSNLDGVTVLYGYGDSIPLMGDTTLYAVWEEPTVPPTEVPTLPTQPDQKEKTGEE